MNNLDRNSTIVGGGAGLMIICAVDYSKLANKDIGQLALFLAGLFIAALGVLTNKGTSNDNK